MLDLNDVFAVVDSEGLHTVGRPSSLRHQGPHAKRTLVRKIMGLVSISSCNTLPNKTNKSFWQMPDSTKVPTGPAQRATLPTQVFLGRETCKKLWLDMQNTILPSWVGRVPRQVGNRKHRKLSADQRRVLATIHLPITLIPLWKDRQGIFPKLLDNFMDLVVSVRLAFSHEVSRDLIEAYDSTYSRYLDSMCSLFPQATITPTQHAARHFGQFLEDFGPARDFNCFAFEQQNHLCQQVPTNHRAGKVIHTSLDMYTTQ